ncbi:hypothetical protein [Wolbachia pipientis]|uniref:hypothetical protein n=1 Tax=Wolbachia pipientis TaxID=955 RepID=UPI0015F82321|nr:hypothetical protein [Wolbachia pipientis]MBA8754149.1 hypothetical protein [Wolbachia pipientis]
MRNNSLEFIGSLNPQLYKHYDLSLSGGVIPVWNPEKRMVSSQCLTHSCTNIHF